MGDIAMNLKLALPLLLLCVVGLSLCDDSKDAGSLGEFCTMKCSSDEDTINLECVNQCKNDHFKYCPGGSLPECAQLCIDGCSGLTECLNQCMDDCIKNCSF